MIKRNRILITAVTLSLLSCRFDSLVLPAEAAPLTQTELVPFGESLVQVLQADLAKALSGNLLKGTSASFSYARLDSLLKKNESCTHINLSKRTEQISESFLEFDCPQVKGNKEVINTKREDSWVFDSTTQLEIYEKDQIYELSDRANLRFSREGDLAIEKEFEDVKKEAFSTSAISGSLTYDLLANGILSVVGTTTLINEGRPERVLFITGTAMKYSECGIHEGVLEISKGQEKLKITFKNCKHQSALYINQ